MAAGTISIANMSAAYAEIRGIKREIAPTTSHTPTTTRIQSGKPRIAANWKKFVSSPRTLGTPTARKSKATSTSTTQTTTVFSDRVLSMGPLPASVTLDLPRGPTNVKLAHQM